jgi:hypothetical protein
VIHDHGHDAGDLRQWATVLLTLTLRSCCENEFELCGAVVAATARLEQRFIDMVWSWLIEEGGMENLNKVSHGEFNRLGMKHVRRFKLLRPLPGYLNARMRLTVGVTG